MARGIEGNEIATPARAPKKPTSSASAGQKSILGFLRKQSGSATPPPPPPPPKPAFEKNKSSSLKTQSITPTPSSDGVEMLPPSSADRFGPGRNKENGLPSPMTSVVDGMGADGGAELPLVNMSSSPSARTKKKVNYAESEDEDEVFKPISSNRASSRSAKRRKIIREDSDEEFGLDSDVENAMAEADLDDFIVPDDSDEEVLPKKRKRSSGLSNKVKSSPPPMVPDDEDLDMPMGGTSTAQQWTYDPHAPSQALRKPPPSASVKKGKQKAHMTEPEKRYPWLANIVDADRNPPGHPDYDPRTIYVPPMAWKEFSPFEKQYWEIKQKFWDTIVFFKKGKFYELYENDATIGNQLFDLKLTDRVNMRMVGVPESSLELWATQFVAKGYKIAKVDQMESALAKEMRERDDHKGKAVKQKEDKIIRRELACVLTSGTLVDGGMLQDDMSTFCVAIKETFVDDHPCFGIAFVDTSTAQFHVTEFEDDTSFTKFETFVAQIRPGELLLEKSHISPRVIRILKNNTSPTTIWNYLKPGKEFWEADITVRELDVSTYFTAEEQQEHSWPKALVEAKDKEALMSALGALIQYLRMLKIDKELISLGNFSWYDPIRQATSLVLDGQSLINLEIFANTQDGGADGTLFSMLNRCVTPFGKRMLRQWVCHPLVSAARINARLDAIDSLMADRGIMDRFTASLSKLPDLERLISRIHAGRCKAQDFVKVIDGFEQIEYTMSLLGDCPIGEGLIGNLVSSMPDLAGKLKDWKRAFDHGKARSEGILVPEPSVEEDFDESQREIDETLASLDSLLKKCRRDLGSNSICYRDNGKEIYQLEVPIKIKNIPKTWDQMSATKSVRRFYFPELRKHVRTLQEAQETHNQIVKEVAGRFYARFDTDYDTWLAAVKIVSQLDCLISLASASLSLGAPSCRPTFVDEKRTVVEFEELRHPCMYNITDFIPNDIQLGGDRPNLSLLTGANAAGKSTVLRMTCIAVILAQIGCHVPCSSARLTPIDRIMSRLGAHDNIFAAQSTFLVELSETAKILQFATPRSLVILDELGRGTSSYDGLAVAQAVLHDVASRIGCVGFFASHYRSLAVEFATHPEVRRQRMGILVAEGERRVTFLYRLEDGVADGSFGMHCAAMCGVPAEVIRRAEEAARRWETSSRLKESVERAGAGSYIPLGMCSDVSWMVKGVEMGGRELDGLRKAIEMM